MLTDQDLISLHAQGRSVYSVAKEYGEPHTSLHRRFTKLGLSVSHRRKARDGDNMVKDKKSEIQRLYGEGLNRADIARQLGCDASSVSRVLKEFGLGATVNNKIYSYDEAFFDQIDTEAKAYVLGFFTADGSNRPQCVTIGVVDLDILEQIRDAIGYNGPFHVEEPETSQRRRQTFYKLSIGSVRFSRALTRLDCPPNKTFVTRFPTPGQVPTHLLPHYIRGVFDGDGSLYHTSNGWHICVAGTEELLAPMYELIKSETGIWVGGIYKHGNIKVLKIPGGRNCTRVLDWLYQGSTIHLGRKRDLYLRMKAETVY